MSQRLAIPVGTLFRSRYEVESVLGKGGFCTTYLVNDRDAFGRRAVLKELLPERENDPKVQALFEREARTLSRLSHAGIPRLEAFFADGGRYYLVEEYVAGKNLAQVLEERGPLPESEVVEIATQVLTILAYLHELTPPVVHRDIKPSNLMATTDSAYRLIDFGAVREVLHPTIETIGHATTIGTPGYTPPEQLLGQAYPASDLYALGATLLHLRTGKHPLYWYNAHEGRWVYELQAVLSPAFTGVLKKLLAEALSDRYHSAYEALTALPSAVGATTTIDAAATVMTDLKTSSNSGPGGSLVTAHDVFISYATKDKPAADAACTILETQGIRCWMAPRNILPGTDWGESIVNAIQQSRVMVLVFSAHANSSPHIKREVDRAVTKGVPIIPIRIEDVLPSKALEYYISSVHWLDAFTSPLDAHLNQLADKVRLLLGTTTEGRAQLLSSPTTPPPPPPSQGTQRSLNVVPQAPQQRDDARPQQINQAAAKAQQDQPKPWKIPWKALAGAVAGLATIVLWVVFSNKPVPDVNKSAIDKPPVDRPAVNPLPVEIQSVQFVEGKGGLTHNELANIFESKTNGPPFRQDRTRFVYFMVRLSRPVAAETELKWMWDGENPKSYKLKEGYEWMLGVRGADKPGVAWAPGRHRVQFWLNGNEGPVKEFDVVAAPPTVLGAVDRGAMERLVREKLAENALGGLQVEVGADGIVTLTGVVENQRQKALAIKVARVHGIKDVVPEINVKGSW